MTDKPPMTELMLTYEKVKAIPDDWHVNCPECGELLDVQMVEQIDGSFAPKQSDTFFQCDCGHLIEVIGIWRDDAVATSQTELVGKLREVLEAMAQECEFMAYACAGDPLNQDSLKWFASTAGKLRQALDLIDGVEGKS